MKDTDIMLSLPGIHVWYKMPEIFLRWIQPYMIDYLLKELDIHLMHPANLTIKIYDNRAKLAEYGVGYIVCAVIGLLFVLAVPLTGLILCCVRIIFRKSDSSQVNRSTQENKRKRVAHAVVLVILSLFIAPMVFCAFVANNAVLATTIKEGGLTDNLFTALNELESYKRNTFKRFMEMHESHTKTTHDKVQALLEQIPKNLSNALVVSSRMEDRLKSIETFAEKINELQNHVLKIHQAGLNVTKIETKLRKSLETIRQNINNRFNVCSDSDPVCKVARTGATKLKTGGDIINVGSVEALQTALQSAADANMSATVIHLRNQINQTKRGIKEKVNSRIMTKTTSRVLNAVESPNGWVPFYVKLFNEMVNFTRYGESVLSLGPDLEKYGWYRYYIFLGCSLLPMIFISLYCLSLLLGTFCKLPRRHGNKCTSCKASNGLQVANALFFIFASFAMLVTTTAFIIGGVLQNEFCRYLRNSSETEQALRYISKDIGTSFARALKLREGVAFDLLGIALRCGKNLTIYKTVDFEAHDLELISLLSVNLYKIEKVYLQRKTKNIKPNFAGKITFPTNELLSVLQSIENAGNTVGREFTNVKTKLSRPPVELNPDYFIAMLESANSGRETRVTNTIQELRDLKHGLVQELTNNVLILETAFNKALRSYAANPAPKASSLNESEYIFNNKAEIILKQAWNRSIEIVVQAIDRENKEMARELEERIGFCRPAYNAAVKIIDAPCVAFLQPFNSLWLSYGTSLLLLAVATKMSLTLARLYRNRGDVVKVEPLPGPNAFRTNKPKINQVTTMTATKKKRRASYAVKKTKSSWTMEF